MHKLYLTLIALILSVNLASCTRSSDTKREDGDEHVKVFLTTLYDSYVLATTEFRDFVEIEDHFSPAILRRLHEAYEYNQGQGYAVWLFRTGAQDGSGTSKVHNVIYEGDNWYTVEFSDMGFDGRCRFKVSNTNNNIYIEAFENPSY